MYPAIFSLDFNFTAYTMKINNENKRIVSILYKITRFLIF